MMCCFDHMLQTYKATQGSGQYILHLTGINQCFQYRQRHVPGHLPVSPAHLFVSSKLLPKMMMMMMSTSISTACDVIPNDAQYT